MEPTRVLRLVWAVFVPPPPLRHHGTPQRYLLEYQMFAQAPFYAGPAPPSPNNVMAFSWTQQRLHARILHGLCRSGVPPQLVVCLAPVIELVPARALILTLVLLCAVSPIQYPTPLLFFAAPPLQDPSAAFRHLLEL
ncbi:hypothetical protein HYPSUDRAFT_201930 [Hypholoma sublateritium FD-334 SS-4]|uniref:Uncharacterized protein n=1 Tax=Hypholoma sublateritium (strain FD-334 SS-4) TaxID=945553 RepID=A0A0D2PSZ7_HYPSF|nr:hypothetical protein HYPSUDRAFT_201930 [Hypholoma sublateritium FD-334 SS-4]